MAASDPVTDLQDEATCSICLEYFRDPVSVECGHSFCRPCISEAWRGLYTNFSCPQCRKISKWKKLRPNRQLASVVEISRRIGAERQEVEARGAELCARHGEALKLYCEEDQTRVCAICRESWSHRHHHVLPADEVTQEYKEKLQSRLGPLRKELAKAQEAKSSEEKKISALTEKVRAEKQTCATELAQLRQMLGDTERAVFTRLEEMEGRIALMGLANVEKLAKKIRSLTQLITEIEEKSHQPAKEFLKDVNTTLSRSNYVTFQHPEPASPQNENKAKCGWMVTSKDWIKSYKVPLTVDPLTAHVQLILSRDKKTIKYMEDALFFSDSPERFNGKPCALARQGFSFGVRYWEVEVGGGVYWTVGAARESVRRKGVFKIKPSVGIWAIGLLGLYRDEYWAFTSPDTPLALSETPNTVGVFLNYEQGRVSFYNADSMETLFTFNDSFTEKIYPFFCVGAVGTELKLFLGQHYQFLALPFWPGYGAQNLLQDHGGSSDALHKEGILVHPYVDAWLIWAKSAEEGQLASRKVFGVNGNNVESGILGKSAYTAASADSAVTVKSAVTGVYCEAIFAAGSGRKVVVMVAKGTPHEKVPLTVDPLTAHVQLILSRDKKIIKYMVDALFFSDNPERFNGKPCALARQRFSFGVRYWEVEAVYTGLGGLPGNLGAGEDGEKKGNMKESDCFPGEGWLGAEQVWHVVHARKGSKDDRRAFCCLRGQALGGPRGRVLNGAGGVPLTVDPLTAHVQLILSRDKKIIKYMVDALFFSDSPERFNGKPCALARQRFSFGVRYWEVEAVYTGLGGLPGNLGVPLTVDPLTAHVQLILSRDKKIIKYMEDALFFSDSPERFNGKPCALARQRFSFGVCYWEVEAVYTGLGGLPGNLGGVGTTLSISVNDHQDRGIRVVCEATGWYPEPDVSWRDRQMFQNKGHHGEDQGSLLSPAAELNLEGMMYLLESPLSALPGLIVVLMSHLFQIGNAAEKFKVIGPDYPVVAVLGEDAVLPCHLSPGLSAERMQVRWFRTGFDSVVHLYENGMDQNRQQLLGYRGRTELIRHHISSGNVSLKIHQVGLHDGGMYTCFFRLDLDYEEAKLELKVAGVGTALSISVNDHQDRGIRVVCESTGWYPEPDVSWKQEDGQNLTSLSETETKQQNGLVNIRTSLLMRTNQYRKVSCHMRNTVLNQERESSISFSDAFFLRVSRWLISLAIILLCMVIPCGLLVVLITYHSRKEKLERGKMSADIDAISKELEWRRCCSYAVDVTLDPETANPYLELSEDGKSVRHGDTCHEWPSNPERFEPNSCVLGREGFSSGRHYWEVEVGDKPHWEFGVCKDSVRRKGKMIASSEDESWATEVVVWDLEGYWVIGVKNGDEYEAVTFPRSKLALSVKPQVVGIFLDYEAGKVSFYSADHKCHLYTFTATFSEKLRPYFNPFHNADGLNTRALRIRPVPDWE
ncbi:uncharacterized protein LOC115080312 [Rhinatrema bivittatum]|uniref:uncharacterized protein LOC115080312 n=1 Tax=Rhinatrema bivittatum TaxID=194408 RepID=UPI001128E614|nr:uncharacterized protein LOC115080312 [Rhinatrema bivittatum]